MSEKNNCIVKPPRKLTHNEEFMQHQASFFKVLADPIRLQILDILREGELCVCEIEPYFDKSQAAISKHLKILVNAGLLELKPSGTKNMYSLKNQEILKLLREVDTILEKTLEEKIQTIQKLRTQAKKK